MNVSNVKNSTPYSNVKLTGDSQMSQNRPNLKLNKNNLESYEQDLVHDTDSRNVSNIEQNELPTPVKFEVMLPDLGDFDSGKRETLSDVFFWGI